MSQIRNSEWEKSLSKLAGGAVQAYDVIDSTNLCAKKWAREGANHGDWVIACMQTGGRGRLGRTFESPDSAGVYMTVILFPAEEKIPLLTVAAAVAVSQAVEEKSGIRPGVKWVNDLLIDGLKICGILAEGVISPDGRRRVAYLPSFAISCAALPAERAIWPPRPG